MARKFSADEDEVRAALEHSHSAAREILRAIDADEKESSPLRDFATKTLRDIPSVLSAAERGDAWAAARWGLSVGMLEGLMQAFPLQYHTKRRRRTAGSTVGRANLGRRKVDDAEIRRVYQLRLEKKPKRSQSYLCKQVAEELGISVSTVRKRLHDLGVLPRASR